MKRSIVATLCFFATCSAAAGQDLEALLLAIPGVKVEGLENVADWKGEGLETRKPLAAIQEYSPVSRTRWRLTEADGVFELAAWQMLDSQGAFGLFALLRPEARSEEGYRSVQAPVEAHSAPGQRMRFWVARWMFELSPAQGGGAAFEDLLRLASRVSASINASLEEPSLHPFAVAQLPIIGLQIDSVRFYLGEEGLRSDGSFPASLTDSVGFRQSAQVAIARYEPPGRELFLIGYPTADVARQNAAQLNGSLQSFYSPEGSYLKRSALLVGLFFGPEGEARALLDRVQYNARVEWLYDAGLTDEERRRRRGEVVTFFGIVTASILFTAAFCVLMVALGILVGLLRYKILQRFPILRAKSDPVRLNLERP